MSKSDPRCLLLADFTVGGMAPYLESSEPTPRIRCTVAPFDQVNRVLLDDTAECWMPRPDVALVWTRPESAVESFGRLFRGEFVESEEISIDVDGFARRVVSASSRVGTLLVPSWTWPAFDRGLGMLNLDRCRGPGYHLFRMNARLIEAVSAVRNVFVLDAGRWIALAGPRASNPKLWHMGKIAFGPEVLRHAAMDVKAACRAVTGRMRKLVVLDLDDTLWGGIVGDAGWHNLRLGGHDPIGEAFCAFQRALRVLTRRGVVLGIVSKNTEAVALEAIDMHPEMVLRRDDFAGWRINWEDKASNVAALANELNLGLDAVVFIDDNPAERARVRQALPDVLTPDWPSDCMLYEQALGELDCFDTVTFTEEDRRRTEMYAAERVRRREADSAGDLAEYLDSLQLRVLVEPLSAVNLGRACQLLNKTNQMNLRTRRMTEAQYWEWASDPAHRAFTYRVEDRFGQYGLTALAGVSVEDGACRIDDFVLSCRIIGRGVEQLVLHTLVEHARTMNARFLRATLIPSSRNEPCRQFFENLSGFDRDGQRYSWDLCIAYAPPRHVTIALASPPTATELG